MKILFIILICISRCWGQFKMVAIDSQTFANLKPIMTSPTTLTLDSLTISTDINSNFASYDSIRTTLGKYHAVIGKFNFAVATICQSLLIPFYITDEQIDRGSNTAALLDLSMNIRTFGGALNYTLSKYNWIQNLLFLSDSSSNAMEILWSLNGVSIKQCNFNPSDDSTVIEGCLQKLNVVNVPGRAYVVITNDNNIDLADKILFQSLYRSVPYNSFIFFPMLNTTNLVQKYFYAGGTLYTIKQSSNDSDTETSYNQRTTAVIIQFINDTLNTNKWNTNFNRTYTLQLLKQLFYKPNGETQSTLFSWKLIKDMNPILTTSVSDISFSQTYSFTNIVSDPTNIAVIDTIKIIYTEDAVFVKTTISEDLSEVISGFLTESLNSLLIPIKISYSSKKGLATNIGRLINNDYTGLLAEMINNNYDMIGFPIPYITANLNRFIYSQSIFTVPFSILMKKPVKTLNYLRLSEPYSPMVWIAIIVTIVFLSVILWLINLISPNIGDSAEKLTFNNSVFMVIGSFLIAKLLVKPNMISTQIFYLLIWLVALLLIASYVANLCVTIAFQKSQSTHFTSYAQLFNQKYMEWAFLENSYLYDMIMTDINNNVSSLIVQMYNYSKKYVLNDTVDIPTFLMNNPNVGLLNDAYHNNYYSLRNCSLVTINDDSYNLSLAYIMQPNFKYQTQLYQQIITLQKIGTIDFLENKYFLVGRCPITNSIVSSVLPLDINDMAGLFLLIVIGIVVSFPVAVIEFLLNKSKLQCQRKLTSSSLRFGQIYRAKVTALDRNGVTVDIGRLSLFSTAKEGRYFYVPKKYLGVKKKGEKEILAPTDQGIMIGTKLLLKYMGNNPVDSKRIFVQVQKKNKKK